MAKAGAVEQLMLEALERAVADPAPRKLHGTKTSPGLFISSSAAAKAASSQCLARGLIREAGVQGEGRRSTPLYSITPGGVQWVLDQSPVPRLLAALLDAADRTAKSVSECTRALATAGQHAAELRQTFERAANRLTTPDVAETIRQVGPAGNGTPDSNDHERLDESLVGFVRQSKTASPLQPVELRDLYRQAVSHDSSLTIGRFHDAVRRLNRQRRVRLLPFTQAMYQLAEPEYAVIIGREVMYYAEPGDSR